MLAVNDEANHNDESAYSGGGSAASACSVGRRLESVAKKKALKMAAARQLAAAKTALLAKRGSGRSWRNVNCNDDLQ